jgi:hypothetical protein
MVRSFLYKVCLLILTAWALALLPSPTEAIPLRLKNGLVGVFAVLWFGKMLYDTLFYDRYQP